MKKKIKKQIEELISTIEKNEDRNWVIIRAKNKRDVIVSLHKLSLDVRGECYQITFEAIMPEDYERTWAYYGARHYIKRVLKLWLKGDKELIFNGSKYTLANSNS